MDYKEEYQKALERAKQGLPIDEVFPELKESEDERIRKEMIHWLKGFIGEEEGCGYTEDEIRERIAYLEKQKEKKLAESAALQKAFISSKTDYTLEEKCDASDYADAILPTSVADGENEEEYKLHKIIEAAFIAGRKKEQKPADLSELMVHKEPYIAPVPTPIVADEQKPAGWSEEDERMLSRCIKSVECSKRFANSETYKAAKDVEMNWLKALPERFNLQPKPEWSEEEKEKLNRIYHILGMASDEHAYSTTCRLIGDKEAIELQDFLCALVSPQQNPEDSFGVSIQIIATKDYNPK